MYDWRDALERVDRLRQWYEVDPPETAEEVQLPDIESSIPHCMKRHPLSPLDRHFAIELGIAGLVNLAHASRTDRRKDWALPSYAGTAAVRLLDSDEDRGLMLLERIDPGYTLASLADDEEATRAASRVMRDLWKPLPPNTRLPTAADWAGDLAKLRKRFNGRTAPLPTDPVGHAEGLFRDVLPSAEPSVLLHGDLHQFNILAARRRSWLAIDPKGLAGEPAYEIGAPAQSRSRFCLRILRYSAGV